MKRAFMLVLGILVGIWPHSVGAQSTWAERLGYPAGKRVVILHADDLGAAHEFNRAATAGLEAGRLQSASVIIPGAWTADLAAWRARHSKYDLGISLSFVAPSPALLWGPVSDGADVPTLVTPLGFFPRTVKEFATRARPDEVRAEARRQIDQAIAMGLRPTHLLPHLGTLFEKPEFLRIYFELAEQYWIPAVMVDLTPAMLDRFARQGRAIDPALVKLVAAYPLPKVDNVATVEDAGSYAEKRLHLFRTIEQLPPGITQLFLTPADDTPALRRMTRRWQNRVWEAQLLSDRQVRQFFKRQGLLFTDWQEIMRRFEMRGQTPSRTGRRAAPAGR